MQAKYSITFCHSTTSQRFNIEAVGLRRKDHEGDHGDVGARDLKHVVQPCQRFDEDVGALVCKFISAGCEEIEGAVKVEIEMPMEVASDKLVDLFLAGGVQVLELVQISLHIEPVWGDQVRFSLHKMSLEFNMCGFKAQNQEILLKIVEYDMPEIKTANMHH